MNQYTEALEWAKKLLVDSKKLNIIRTQEIEFKSYSIVYKIDTDCGIFYLKQTPPELYVRFQWVCMTATNALVILFLLLIDKGRQYDRQNKSGTFS